MGQRHRGAQLSLSDDLSPVPRISILQRRSRVFSSWTDNRTKLVGEGLPQTGNLLLDKHADGYELDTARFHHDAARNFMHRIDETVADEAAASVRTRRPRISPGSTSNTPMTWVICTGDSPEYDTRHRVCGRAGGTHLESDPVPRGTL